MTEQTAAHRRLHTMDLWRIQREAQAEALRDAAKALPGFDAIATHGDAARWLRARADALEGQNTPVSTPSGPSAGLEGQDATQETPDATGAAQRRVEAFAQAVARAVIAVADAEHHQRLAEIDAVAQTEWRARAEAAEARVAELEAIVAKVRELHVQDGDFCGDDGFTWPCRTVRAILDAPKDTTAP